MASPSFPTPPCLYVSHVHACRIPAGCGVLNVPANDGAALPVWLVWLWSSQQQQHHHLPPFFMAFFSPPLNHIPLHIHLAYSSPWDTRLFKTPTPRSTARAAACAGSAVRAIEGGEEEGKEEGWWVGKQRRIGWGGRVACMYV